MREEKEERRGKIEIRVIICATGQHLTPILNII